jgi:hypothetical protein
MARKKRTSKRRGKRPTPEMQTEKKKNGTAAAGEEGSTRDLRKTPEKRFSLKKIIGITIAAISLCIGCRQCLKGATKQRQERILSEVGATKQSQEQILSEVGEVKDLLVQRMRKIDDTQYDTLIKKYPLGYMLFAVDHRRVVIPGITRLGNGFKVDWEGIEMVGLTKENIDFRIAAIHVPPGIEVTETIWRCPREVGTYPLITMLSTRMLCEVLSDDNRGMICLLGFRK